MKSLKEVSEIVGIEVKSDVKSHRRSGFDFGQGEEILETLREIRDRLDLQSGMIQESLERMKKLERKPQSKYSVPAFLNPILRELEKGTRPEHAGKIFSAQDIASRINPEVWEAIKVPAILSLTPMAELTINQDGMIALGPSFSKK